MFVFFFDPTGLLLILAFFVIGAIGILMSADFAEFVRQLIMASVILTGAIALLVFTVKKYGKKGLITYLAMTTTLIVSLLTFSYYKGSPQYRSKANERLKAYVCRVTEPITWDEQSLEPGDYVSLAVVPGDEVRTDVNLYTTSGQIGFYDRVSRLTQGFT